MGVWFWVIRGLGLMGVGLSDFAGWTFSFLPSSLIPFNS